MTVCEAAMLSCADVELLEHHLSQEIAAQGEVLRGLQEQERLLVKNDVEGLRRFLAESDPLLARLQALTEMRMRIVALLAKHLGIDPSACGLRDVLEAVADADRERLSAQAARLRSKLKEVDRITRRVNVLLRHAAETNEALLHALLGGPAPLRTYGPDGQATSSGAAPRFTRDL
jgi:hypothetical protein